MKLKLFNIIISSIESAAFFIVAVMYCVKESWGMAILWASLFAIAFSQLVIDIALYVADKIIEKIEEKRKMKTEEN